MELRCVRQQHVVLDAGERIGCPREIAVPRMVEVQRGTVVDEPELAMPDQQVRVARGAIDVAHERVEPDDRRGERGIRLVDHWIERDRSRQVVEREVEAAARADQVLDFRVGLGAREVGIELDEDDLRHRQAKRARELARDESELVRGFVAVNFYVPADVMEELAEDESSVVRGLVAWKAGLAGEREAELLVESR